MSRRAARVDANHAAVVAALRKCGCVVQDLSAVGGGCVDLMVGHRATRRIFGVEVKDGRKPLSDRRLTPAQVAWHAEWAGLPVYIVERVEQVPALLAGEPARVVT